MPSEGQAIASQRDRLDLVAEYVELRIIDGRTTKRPRAYFLNLVVNGRSLSDLVEDGSDLVTT